MLEIKCWLDEEHNTLHMANGNLNVVVVPNDHIDTFIDALSVCLSSVGSGNSFTLDFRTGEVKYE